MLVKTTRPKVTRRVPRPRKEAGIDEPQYARAVSSYTAEALRGAAAGATMESRLPGLSNSIGKHVSRRPRRLQEQDDIRDDAVKDSE